MKLLKRLSQYKVRKGDTLGKIAVDNDIDILDLLDANKDIENPDMIYADSTINIPKKLQYKTDEMSGTGIPVRDKIGFNVRKNLFNRGLSMYDEEEAPTLTGTGMPPREQIKNMGLGVKHDMKNQIAEFLMGPQKRFDEERERSLSQEVQELFPEKRPDIIDYKVQKGDTISIIARRNKLNIDQLLDSNKELRDNPDKINIGQTLRVPQFGLQEADEFQARLNTPAAKPKERLLPSNVRQLLSDINPVNRLRRNLNIGMEDFTAADLTPAEFDAAKDIVRSVIADGKNTISYKDFETSEGAYDDVGGEATGIEKAIQKFQDPAFALKTLIGQATITQNDRGETIIIDRYNFNEEDPNSFKDYAQKIARVVSDPIYGSFREAGSIYGSNEGEGSFIRLNLGRL